jgi:hypothetical protein
MTDFLFNSGCIWGFFEYIGTIKYLKNKKIDIGKIYGVSSGSAIALCLLLDIDIDELTEFCIKVVTEFKTFTDLHIMGCEFVLKKIPDAYKIANDRLHIGITSKDKFYFKNTYTSNLDLANTIICSSSIPILSSYETICDTVPTIDGGFSFRQEYVPKNVIVIRPTTTFPISAIPPSDVIQKLLILLGYHKAEGFIFTQNNRVGDEWYTDPQFIELWFYLYANCSIFERKCINDVKL